MTKTSLSWIGCALAVLLLAVLLVPACSQDEEAPPTGPSALSSSSELARPTSPLAHGDSNSEDDDSESEDDDSESEDDDSESEDDDSESEDDDSGSEDDDSASEDDGLDDNGSRVRGLLFDFGGCPVPPTLTIGATSVTTTETTRFDCEPTCNGQEENLTAADFCSFLTPGLPMRARGTDNAGAIDASRVRIDDEIKAAGTISLGSSSLTAGTMFTLTVNGLMLPFVVGEVVEIDVFDAGATVRVEGIVPPLDIGGTPTYIATEIEN